jgi:hypothetical protein
MINCAGRDQCFVCGDELMEERVPLGICYLCGKVTQCEPVPPFLLDNHQHKKAPFKYHASHIMERMRAEMKARVDGR